MAHILPFPAVRRIAYVRRMARLLASYRPAAADRALRAQLEQQRDVMLRRGFSAEVVECELRSLELAIRVRLWVIVMQGGDAA